MEIISTYYNIIDKTWKIGYQFSTYCVPGLIGWKIEKTSFGSESTIHNEFRTRFVNFSSVALSFACSARKKNPVLPRKTGFSNAQGHILSFSAYSVMKIVKN